MLQPKRVKYRRPHIIRYEGLSKGGNEVSFGEYANPSFESQIETVGKAKTQGVMSIESIVEELYGDSKTDDWKAEEVRRIKNEQGIAELEEPSMI